MLRDNHDSRDRGPFTDPVRGRHVLIVRIHLPIGFQILKIKGVLRHVEVLAQDRFPQGFAGSTPPLAFIYDLAIFYWEMTIRTEHIL
jgi:hypothetical protein